VTLVIVHGTFARIASAMSLAGAPFDLVAEASRIVSDGMRKMSQIVMLGMTYSIPPMSIF
jgi:hypothetical protein